MLSGSKNNFETIIIIEQVLQESKFGRPNK